MATIELELDSIEIEWLTMFSSINNITLEQAASLLVAMSLQEVADGVLDDEPVLKH